MDVKWFVIGVGTGLAAASAMIFIRPTQGVLKIDHSNPEKDIYRFEIDEKVLEKLDKRRRLHLKIDHEAKLSQD